MVRGSPTTSRRSIQRVRSRAKPPTPGVRTSSLAHQASATHVREGHNQVQDQCGGAEIWRILQTGSLRCRRDERFRSPIAFSMLTELESAQQGSPKNFYVVVSYGATESFLRYACRAGSGSQLDLPAIGVWAVGNDIGADQRGLAKAVHDFAAGGRSGVGLVVDDGTEAVGLQSVFGKPAGEAADLVAVGVAAKNTETGHAAFAEAAAVVCRGALYAAVVMAGLPCMPRNTPGAPSIN